MHDKELLLKFRRSSATNVYSLGNFTDYFYGYMPDTTEKLSVFNVTRYKNGILLIFPDIKNPEKLGAVEKRDKLFETLEESNEWAKSIGVDYVGSLNKQISDGNSGELILLAEALQEKKIAQIAEMVRSSGDRRFIMIAGPSSSGKTTFSHRLSIQLRLVGFKPHAIGLDNYYKNRIDAPRDEYGNFDFECLEALDVKQFNEDMVKLLKGGEVEMPTFNFKTGLREYKGDRLKLGEKDILVIEGIHGLNDKLSYSLPELSKFKIYISALTQLNVDEHNRIPTTDARLLRRIVRDARTRGTSAKDTIAMWDSVRRGEEKYIFPYQEEADVMFNSALVYELCAIKQYAEPLLFGIEPDCKEYEEAKRLLKFLDYFQGINTETIPINSICREFIGGSCFNV
jgi:uridine kinase